MYRIIKIGLDVHTTNFTICAMESLFMEEDKVLAEVSTDPDPAMILRFIERLKKKYKLDDDCDIECGYEAGCLGYTLYEKLTAAGVKCVILAPSTMSVAKGPRIKTDKRDARLIAQCLINNTYHAVHIPEKDDYAVKEYIRMRDDHKVALKKIKQQILAFCLHNGYRYDSKTTWTNLHVTWLRKLDLRDELLNETLDEYMATYDMLQSKIELLDAKIEEIAKRDKYRENVGKLGCLLGVKTHTALSMIVETGDFTRFNKGNTYAAYLGLAPGEHSSSTDTNRLSITKAGNKHLRKLLTESAQGICKGSVGQKSKALRSRQAGQPADVVAYADKANERLRRKYYRMIRNGKKRNVAITAVARELACFIWGLMTDNIYMEVAA